MTLTAKRRPPSYHKKYSGRHHRQSKTYHKPYWPYLPLLAVAIAGFLLNSAVPSKHSVLGYATGVSVQGLFDDTNVQRSSNSEANLSLNATLNQVAQAKANDMVARDYWSHDTPDGQTPWSFYTAAGYCYLEAGENLAYGFATSSDVVTGWMNSPEHRANILNADFVEVGFGFANSSNYQGTGPETVVVAEYAKPCSAATQPTTASAPPTSQPTASGSAAETQGGAPVSSTPDSTPTSTAQQPAASEAQPTKPSQEAATTATPQTTTVKVPAEPAPQRISRVQILTAGKASWSLFATSLIVSLAIVVFLVRHSLAWHRVIRKGERFILKHWVIDVVAIVLIILGFILTRTAGMIR